MNKQPIIDVIKLMNDVASDEATPEAPRQFFRSCIERLSEFETPDERFVKGTPIPTAVGAMADEYSVVRAERLRIEKIAKVVKERETELYNVIMSTLNESTDTGAAGNAYMVQRVEKEQYRPADWPTIWNYIQQTGDFDILGKSLNKTALKDRVEAGTEVPGVSSEMVPTLSFTKVKS